jgi:hypothetical protein
MRDVTHFATSFVADRSTAFLDNLTAAANKKSL